MKKYIACLVLPLLAACNPVAADPKDEILGRWESREWGISGHPLYVQFTNDGKLQHMTRMGTTYGTWIILDSGDLQVSYSWGKSRSCAMKIEGDALTLTPPSCLEAWDDIGGTATFYKK